ncbi:hypothetical protein Pst134EA_017545 [Puccinia striiformis f. sp. tritici]|uniref:Coatomer subunit delta n=1 Tax=Puccinia striiformis f. sp. tritici PST-78 TaxID=1165861 RepID=A0A0L0V6Z5_9BASI|nr:hypothetical protein Pst134EA_017545 [Puccinia striiformis f. sp. tritici]KAH9461237.1 hypothetical protein Pst134EA_017545 [Puccinia striiformis f. sp. tritici]KAI9615259.1 hypothetical protein KEM48_005685 [Puccinia striiformis f. sp. tritici PST-130]KNE95037.1 hypothetical protein PSTG_11634 [Puccinia striiformis f. sp. tritici PST-78]
MVVLSASIVTKGGRPVISRQFREFPRARLESLLATFPKLIPPSSQHTVIDDPTSSIRYVYQPLEDLWLVILTNRQSNILQDIDTLQLLSRIVSDFCRGTVTETEVLGRSFEVLSSFDEVVSMGYREKIDLNGIRSVMEMESHEEKIQEIIAKNKEQEAKEELKRRAKQLDSQRREALKRGQSDVYSTGMGSGGGGGGGGYDRPYQPSQPVAPVVREDPYSSRTPVAAKPFKTKGMQLGSKSKTQGVMGDEYSAPGPWPPVSVVQSTEPTTQPTSAPQTSATKVGDVNPFAPETQENVHLILREKITAELGREGGLSTNSAGINITGSLELKVSSESENTKIWLSLDHGVSKGSISNNDLQFKTHPNVDKKAWSDNKIIKLKDSDRGFPTKQGLAVLKWRLNSKDETLIPISINCWPTTNDDGGCDVNIEYEAENENVKLHNLVISIPLPEGSYPKVISCDGTYEIQSEDTPVLQWKIGANDDDDDDNNEGLAPSAGSMEFNCPDSDPDSFFPVSVSFISQNILSQVSVVKVATVADDQPIEFSSDTLLSTEEYAVV